MSSVECKGNVLKTNERNECTLVRVKDTWDMWNAEEFGCNFLTYFELREFKMEKNFPPVFLCRQHSTHFIFI